MRRTALLVAAAILLAVGCDKVSGDTPPLAEPTSTSHQQPTSTTTPASTVAPTPVWTRIDTPQPPLVAGTVGYQLDNGRILWVEEHSGVGHVFANPDEANADQWKCAALLGDIGAFYDHYRSIPNFDAVVCHPFTAGTP
jgi:hypothetical protein